MNKNIIIAFTAEEKTAETAIEAVAEVVELKK